MKHGCFTQQSESSAVQHATPTSSVHIGNLETQIPVKLKDFARRTPSCTLSRKGGVRREGSFEVWREAAELRIQDSQEQQKSRMLVN